MFKINWLRPVLYSFTRNFSTVFKEKPTTAPFGNADMPDKLYKTIELEMKSAEPAVLKSYQTFITSVAEQLEIEMGKTWSLKKPLRQRWDLLKSVHIYRKHIVQYEVRTHYTWMQVHKLTGSTADTFLEYIERMLPEGVALKVTRLSIEPLPKHLADEIKTEENEGSNEINVNVDEGIQSAEKKELITEDTKGEISPNVLTTGMEELKTENTKGEISSNVLTTGMEELKTEDTNIIKTNEDEENKT